MQVLSFCILKDTSHTPRHSVEDELVLVVELALVRVGELALVQADELALVQVDELALVLVDEQVAASAVILALLSPSAKSMVLSMVLATLEVVALSVARSTAALRPMTSVAAVRLMQSSPMVLVFPMSWLRPKTHATQACHDYPICSMELFVPYGPLILA